MAPGPPWRSRASHIFRLHPLRAKDNIGGMKTSRCLPKPSVEAAEAIHSIVICVQDTCIQYAIVRNMFPYTISATCMFAVWSPFVVRTRTASQQISHSQITGPENPT